MRIVFMGTPDFAVPSLKRLVEGGFKPMTVVTAPDRKKGRGLKVSASPVKVAAQELGIPVLQPDSVKDPDFATNMERLDIDLMVVVAFRILPVPVFTQTRLGAFNLHASLLPQFRGAAPINRAIMSGADRSGVTTFFLEKKVDTGNMILQKETPIGPDMTAGELHDRLMTLGAEAVLETVQLIAAGDPPAIPQDGSLATPAPKIFKEDCRISWSEDVEQIRNHVRGLSPYPGAWTRLDERTVKIFAGRALPEPTEDAPGHVLDLSEGIRIACGTGSFLVTELQLEGRKRVAAEDFLRGSNLAVGDLFN